MTLLVVPDRAGAQSTYESCFRSEPAFRCYDDWWCPPTDPGSRYFPGDPPAIRLSRDPFLTRWEIHNSALLVRDADHDRLADASELEIARAVSIYYVNACARQTWTYGAARADLMEHGGDPDLGEPVELFQVRPFVTGWGGPVSPDSRRILVTFGLLWDWDDGYVTAESPCGFSEGYTFHAGDDDRYSYVLEMVADDPVAPGSLWRILRTDNFTAWWYIDRESEDRRGEALGVHPVPFFSCGKHHNKRGECWGCFAESCAENFYCPTADLFGGGALGEWKVANWHGLRGPFGTGRYLLPVDGNLAMNRNGGWVGYEGPVFRNGNNVGEPDYHFMEALREFCVFRVVGNCAPDPSSCDPYDPGAVWWPWCFQDEWAWDWVEFWGGHCGTCVRDDRWEHTTPLGDIWANYEITDIDRDGLPDDSDYCHLQAEGERGPWSPLFDRDGDGMTNACDICPDEPRYQWGDEVSDSDVDADGVVDACDICPGGDDLDDADRDGIPDWCDLCVQDHRVDAATARPEFSSDHNDHPADGWPGPNDEDGDDVGDRCDYCRTVPGPRYLDEGRILTGGGERRPVPFVDTDGDGIGNRCDNCILAANREQSNCNAGDERRRPEDDPGFLRDGEAWAAGLGDACDAYPCVDRCLGNAFGLSMTEIDSTYDDEHGTVDDAESLTARFCAAGGDDTHRSPQAVPAPMDFRTRVRGCYCTREEEARGECTWLTRCPLYGLDDGRWLEDDILYSYPGSAPTREQPIYQYEALYRDDPDRGLVGPRGSYAGPYAYSGGYAGYYAAAGYLRQPWSWKDDLCVSERLDSCMGYLNMWFKPQSTPGTWFATPYGALDGNTYAYLEFEDWQWVNGLGLSIVAAGSARTIPSAGESLIPSGRQLGLWGQVVSPAQTVADLIWSHLCRTALDCPWPPWMFFDTRGTRIGGIVVSRWDESRNTFGPSLGTKLAEGAAFDVVSPSVAFAFDSAGSPSRYWLFGGVDAAGEPTDQMWGARRAKWATGDTIAYIDGQAGEGGVALDGADAFFRLASVPRGQEWPPARTGATLLCTGVGVVGGRACDGLCPKVDVAMGVSPPPEGAADAAGSLILIGGEDAGGPLGDIWMYDEKATWQPPPDAAPGDGGPWPSGWRLAGTLAGADVGLAQAGSVQVGRTLWMFGGRGASGPTADLWRVDLDTGAAERLPAVGPGPAARVSPALAYDPGRNRLVVFGGTTGPGGTPLTDIWTFDLSSGVWASSVNSCTGNGCPAVTGRESLRYDAAAAEPTVIADRAGPDGDLVAWTLREGIWENTMERLVGPGRADCDDDGAVEDLAGLRCDVGGWGFPGFGRLRCDGAGLACRAPVTPTSVLWEYSMPDVRAVAAWKGELLLLRDRRVHAHPVAEDGRLLAGRAIVLRRAGQDIAVAGDSLLAAEGNELGVYDLRDGARLSSVGTCGKARRVFADGTRVFVVGVRCVLVVDITDPRAPVVISRVRLSPRARGLDRWFEDGCSWFWPALDRLCDAMGACGPFGRDVAAYRDGRLFLNILGSVYVLDFRSAAPPAVSDGVPVGLLTEMAAEGPFLYGNSAFRGTVVLVEGAGGVWRDAGTHDVPRWVEGVARVGDFAAWAGRRMLRIAGGQ